MRAKQERIVAVALVVAAMTVALSAWAWVRSRDVIATDNAYIRGDVTSLAPRVTGYVVSVAVLDNQEVRCGDILFRIDDRDYRARLAQADANVAAAQSRLADVSAQARLQHSLVGQAEAQRLAAVTELNLATKTVDRRRGLIQSRAVSQALFDESDAGQSRAAAGVDAASAALDAQRKKMAVIDAAREAAIAAIAQAEAARDLARIDLDSTVVRAPIAGIVGNRQVRVGRLVAAGTPLLDIVPVDDIWVVANFKETQLERIQLAQKVRISVDGYPDEALEGVVDSFSPGSGSAFSLLPADNATGNFVRVVQRVPVKIRFVSNPLRGRLVPGLSVRVKVEVDRNGDS